MILHIILDQRQSAVNDCQTHIASFLELSSIIDDSHLFLHHSCLLSYFHFFLTVILCIYRPFYGESHLALLA